MTTGPTDSVRGVAAGVPYVALPPPEGGSATAIVLAWHLADPPSTPAAMAAALPVYDLDAWRVYLTVPLHGDRMPEGGPEEVFRLAMDDAVLNIFGPAITQAAEEAPAVLDALRDQLEVTPDATMGLLGGSIGSAVVQLLLAEGGLPARAAAIVSPVVQLARIVAANEALYGVTYTWSDASRAVAERLDFVARVDELTGPDPQPALLLVAGADDSPHVREPAARLVELLKDRYRNPSDTSLVTVPGMGHALAEPPGIEPAPQTPAAVAVDAAVTEWFRQHLTA